MGNFIETFGIEGEIKLAEKVNQILVFVFASSV